MSLLESSNEYWEFLGQCTQCGHCTQACESLTTANMTLGDIAKSLLDAQRDAGSSDELAIKLAANEQLTQAVRGCFFCTTCKNTCFAHNDVSTLIYHARDDYQKLGLIPRRHLCKCRSRQGMGHLHRLPRHLRHRPHRPDAPYKDRDP